MLQPSCSRLVFGRKAANQGFSLTELIVSIAIIGMVATLFVVNYRAAERQYRLNGAMDQLVSDMRLVQSYALGAKKSNGQVPVGGWGIHFTASSNQYRLFADSGPANPGVFDAGNGDVVVRTVTLPSSIKVDGTTGGLAVDGVAATYATVTFLPPDPQTKVYADGLPGNFLMIDLKDALSNRLRRASVNSFGLIDLP